MNANAIVVSANGFFTLPLEEGVSDGTEKSTADRTVTVTVMVKPRPSLGVRVDGTMYAGDSLPKSFIWDVGSNHTLKLDRSTIDLWPVGIGARYTFAQWSDGSKETTRNIIALQNSNYTAEFKAQYVLSISSEAGNPKGAGWYDADTEATVSITPYQPEPGIWGVLGARKIFKEWSFWLKGKSEPISNSPTLTIKMDDEKWILARWTTDYSQPYMIIGGAAAVIVLIGIFSVRKHKNIHAPHLPRAGLSRY